MANKKRHETKSLNVRNIESFPFPFFLLEWKLGRQDENNNPFDQDTKQGHTSQMIATIGVVRTPGGLEAMALSSTGAVSFAPVVNVHETSKYWLSDIICESTQKDYARNTFVWAIEILNGDLYCWSVPFLCDFHSEVRRKCLSKKGSEYNFQSHLHLPA